VLFVMLGSTAGLRVADEELVHSMERAGARVAVAEARRPGDVRTMALTDLLWARSARRAAGRELGRLGGGLTPGAVIYSTTTAALLWPRRGAIRFDAAAAANRPGRHGIWQRPLERRRLREAPLLLPSSAGALAEARTAVPDCGARALVVPAAIASPPPLAPGREELPERNIAAITYAANPHKKGLDRVLEAWRRVRRPSERLVVAGVSTEGLRANGFDVSGDDAQVVGLLSQIEYRGLLRRSQVFICAPRREEYGLAQLEALAEGCRLVSSSAPGGYVALPIARQLDPRLVGEDLGAALRCALDTPTADYELRARSLLEPFTAGAVDRIVAEELLPRLLGE
jgi:glycosyltransferase involved in cell wall biosynthesis